MSIKQFPLGRSGLMSTFNNSVEVRPEAVKSYAYNDSAFPTIHKYDTHSFHLSKVALSLRLSLQLLTQLRCAHHANAFRYVSCLQKKVQGR